MGADHAAQLVSVGTLLAGALLLFLLPKGKVAGMANSADAKALADKPADKGE